MNLSKFTNKLLEVLKIIPEGVTFSKNGEETASVVLPNGQTLFEISSSGIQIPGVSIPDNFLNKPSPLLADFVPKSQIEDLFKFLNVNHLFQRLNHLGLCYSVGSVRTEKEKLIREISKTDLHLYEEKSSNDSSAWLFIGDKNYWQYPLIELVLVEKTHDKWKDYWLPGFQIDIDTYLNGDEIENLIAATFKRKVKPYRIIATDKFIVLVRARLGIVSGININLDLGFEGRMTRSHRVNLLTQLA